MPRRSVRLGPDLRGERRSPLRRQRARRRLRGSRARISVDGTRARTVLRLPEPGRRAGPIARVRGRDRRLPWPRAAAMADWVASEVGVGRPPASPVSAARRAAMEPYLRGRTYLEGWDVERNYARAEEAFQKAIERDPAFAEAHAGLALALFKDYEETRRPERVPRAEKAAERAVALAPDLPEARLAQGVIQLGRGLSAEAASTLQRAQDLAAADDVVGAADRRGLRRQPAPGGGGAAVPEGDLAAARLLGEPQRSRPLPRRPGTVSGSQVPLPRGDSAAPGQRHRLHQPGRDAHLSRRVGGGGALPRDRDPKTRHRPGPQLPGNRPLRDAAASTAPPSSSSSPAARAPSTSPTEGTSATPTGSSGRRRKPRRRTPRPSSWVGDSWR